MARAHNQLIAEILLAFSKGNIRLWRNETGMAISPDGQRPIKYGLPGSSDILGLVGPAGRFIAIECKVGRDRQSQKQQAFQVMVTKLGGIYCLARSPQDVLDSLANQNLTTTP